MGDNGSLNQEIYDQSWSGEHFGPNGMLWKAKRRYRREVAEGNLTGALSALSSSYYTASGNAFSRWKLAKWQLWWLWRAAWCAFQAKCKSDRFARIVPKDQMSSGQACVRSSILITFKQYGEAKKLLEFMLRTQALLDDDQALLLINHAKVAKAEGYFGLAHSTLNEAVALENNLKPTTRVRLYRALGELWGREGNRQEAESCFFAAATIAEEEGLHDQSLKILTNLQ